MNVTQSAVRNAIGMRSTETQYHFTLENSSDMPFFLNNITFTEVNWHPDIDLGFASTEGFSHGGGDFYTFGTPINSDEFFSSDGFLRRFGTVAPTVTAGLYEFDVTFLGGLDGTSFDPIGSIRYELEVVERIDLTVGGTATPGSITTGEMTTVQMTIQNDMIDRSFVSSGLFFVNGGMEMGTNDLNFGTFGGDWFDQTIAAGGSRTADHSTWTAGVEDEPGIYTATAMGVIGGLHSGDQHSWIMNSPQPSVVVNAIPEPSTWALLALGVTGLAVRFRRATSGR